MKTTAFFTFMFLVFIVISCNKKDETEINTQLKMHKDVEKIIIDYMKEHPQYNTLLLKSTDKLEKREESPSIQGFLLGPGYKSLIEEKNGPAIHFDISGKRIFYICSIDELVQNNKTDWIIENISDSIFLDNGWIIKNPTELFLYKSIYFYYDKDEMDSLVINTRPDTIFAPRLLSSSIEFQNIK